MWISLCCATVCKCYRVVQIFMSFTMLCNYLWISTHCTTHCKVSLSSFGSTSLYLFLELNCDKRWWFPKLVLLETLLSEQTHFIFKTMIAYKIFFWKRNKLGEKSRFFFLRLGAKWDFSLVQGKTLSLLSYLAFGKNA